ncbi:transcription elongation factor TFIIS-like [Melia azedarach]|uniref:Transcription elongation factor TFIIS-like n=1 Tax=Melia azedarach TaxID=155640 RepID=A0ACC1YC98_MELAZ|nr:transcription elongation factor TFIIS-like [Melia azedarach]
MDKDLLRLAEGALKAAESAANVDDGFSVNKRPEVCRCVALLKKLKEFPMTYDVLVSTQVDKRLRHLRNHNKEKVRLMAKWLLEIWSSTIKDGLSRNQKRGLNVIPVASTKPRNDEGSKNKRKRDREEDGVEKEEGGFNCFMKPSREPKVSKPTVTVAIKSSDASRNKVREILVEALRKVGGEVAGEDNEEMKEKVRDRDPVAVAESVESVMFKKLGPFNGANKFKYRSIIFNVKDPKNQDFRRKILLGEVKPERLVGLTTEEMASNERQCENKQIKEKTFSRIQEPVKEESVGKSDNELVWLDSMW